MNEEIKAYIVTQCLKRKMEIVERTWFPYNAWELCYINEFASVKIIPGHLEGIYYFETWSEEISRELLFRFPIPETLRGFMQVCNVLKVFHDHT